MQPWQVETQCPQCGAPVTLKEAQHVLNCPYCKTRLYLTSRGPFRYAISPKHPLDETVFLPFWRIKGLGFTAYLPPKTVGKPIDKTFLAVPAPLKLISLGMRPQATHLTFAHTEKGPFLFPRANFKDLMARVTRQLDATLTERETLRKETSIFLSDLGETDPFNRSDFSGWNTTRTQTVFKKYEPVLSVFLDEGNSLVYFPVNAAEASPLLLRDGLTGRPIGKMDPASWEALLRHTTTELTPPGTLPLLCPNCGWDLKCAEESWAVTCPGCNRVWGIRGENYVSIPFEVEKGEKREAFYLPFWKFETTVPELDLHSVQDLSRFSNQLRPQTPAPPLSFFIPAFKVQPRLFLQICKLFTLAQPETRPADKIPRETYPILLPHRKVLKLIPIVLAEIGSKKEKFFPKLAGIKPETKRTSLAFLPFRKTGYELIYQGALTFAIPRNALKWGRML